MRRAWRIMSAGATLLASAAIMLSVLLFVQSQDILEDAATKEQKRLEDRAVDQRETNRLICERQELVTQRLIDVKGRSMKISRAMRILILRVRRVTPVGEWERRAALLRTAHELSGIIGELRAGRRELQTELDSVDCARLPAAR
jgi:hypothetical protein